VCWGYSPAGRRGTIPRTHLTTATTPSGSAPYPGMEDADPAGAADGADPDGPAGVGGPVLEAGVIAEPASKW
jgi:hypothetical protein